MSIVDNEHKKNYVVTYKELVFAFIVFVVILVVLYPKDLLKQQISSEKSNYDLSMLYLTDLLKHSPNDESLMIILAEQSLRSGNKAQSIKLLDKLTKSRSKKLKNQALVLSYELKKDNYYYIKDKKKQLEAKEELRRLFQRIFYQNLYSKQDIDRWYNEAVFLDESVPMYFFLQEKIAKDPSNVELLEKAYYLSIKFNKPKDSVKYMKLLLRYDTDRKEKWLQDNYYMLVNSKNYAMVEKFLERESKNSIEWKKKAADYYLMRKSFKKASKEYIEIYNKTKDYTERKTYFMKAVRALQAGNYLQESAALAHKYENYYIHDKEARKFLLKVYLGTANLDYASSLSKKILKRGLK
jgi:predicted Zn-dependent protease